MQVRDIVSIVQGTADPAFAVDGLGTIIAWNATAEECFGIESSDACGTLCWDVLRGTDECGTVCTDDCVVQQNANRHQLLGNFDLMIETPAGKKWFNVSLITVDVEASQFPSKIHVLREIDVQKRLEVLVRNFIVTELNITDQQAVAVMSTERSAARGLYLTKRELEVLSLTADGLNSSAIAEKLCISPTTVNNHLQHILKKLKAHSRLEAVHRAEHARIL